MASALYVAALAEADAPLSLFPNGKRHTVRRTRASRVGGTTRWRREAVRAVRGARDGRD